MGISGLGTGVGLTLAYTLQTGSGTLTTVDDVIAVGVSKQGTEITDISDSGGTNNYNEYLPGMLEPGVLHIALRYGETYGTSAPTWVTQLQAIKDERGIGKWTLTYPGGATFYCYGFIVDFSNKGHYRSGIQYSLTIKLSGKPTYTEASAGES